jgi:hypothetical protein
LAAPHDSQFAENVLIDTRVRLLDERNCLEREVLCPRWGKERNVEIKSMETSTPTPDAAFVYIDLADSAGWEKLENLLAEAELPALDMFAEQVDCESAKWSRQ